MKKIQEQTGVFLLTSEKPDNFEIAECYGLVTGQSIMGANFVRDFFAKVADVTGGSVTGYEKALNSAMEQALTKMAIEASKMGANAVIGIDIDTSAVGGKMLMSSCYGTAVELKPKS